MALIVENGSSVSGSNTYVSLAEYQAWAAERGITHTGSDANLITHIYRAMDYIESLKFIGGKANENQSMQWPRLGAIIDGYEVDGTEIPAQLKNAVYESVYATSISNSELAPLERRTQSEKIGDIQITYANNSDSKTTSPALQYSLRKLLTPLSYVSRA
tara:strand:+ start:1363 stop:1839 length:477 start_codon:yes stop_codon:yes gene_type:complete